MRFFVTFGNNPARGAFRRNEDIVTPPSWDGVLERARKRDPQALTALVEAFSSRVFGLLFRLTGSREVAEDLTQETFLRVVRTIADYEHSGKFEVWLFRIAGNLARDLHRQQKRRGPTASLDGADGDRDFDVAQPRDASDGSLANALANVEQESRLRECLERLPEQDREIVLLRHFSELSFREIAEMLGVPLGTARARGHRALARLRQEMELNPARRRESEA